MEKSDGNAVPNVQVIPNPPAPGKKPLSYEKRLRVMDRKDLKLEVARQLKIETRRTNYEGVILATILETILDSKTSGSPR